MNQKAAATVVLTLVGLGLIALLLTPAPARSNPLPTELSAPNDASGHTYLTFQPCMLEIAPKIQEKYIKHSDEPLFYAYSIAFEGTEAEIRSHGCWFVPHIDSDEAGPGAVPVINIFAETGMIFPHPLSEFAAAPVERKEVHGEF